jgi:indolepyruvate ferredoxin oxidoreductase
MALVTSAASGIEGADAFVWAAARSAYKVMAYKDEYEVARLYSDGRFRTALTREFEDVRSIRIHLAPPFLSSMSPRTGRVRKHAFGRWIMVLFQVLHRLRGLRESPFDIFGRSAERRLERELREAYLSTLAKLARALSVETLSLAVGLAGAPEDVRGFGHIKTGPARALLARLRLGSQ